MSSSHNEFTSRVKCELMFWRRQALRRDLKGEALCAEAEQVTQKSILPILAGASNTTSHEEMLSFIEELSDALNPWQDTAGADLTLPLVPFSAVPCLTRIGLEEMYKSEVPP
jgi:hypothetical protein